MVDTAKSAFYFRGKKNMAGSPVCDGRVKESEKKNTEEHDTIQLSIQYTYHWVLRWIEKSGCILPSSGVYIQCKMARIEKEVQKIKFHSLELCPQHSCANAHNRSEI